MISRKTKYVGGFVTISLVHTAIYMAAWDNAYAAENAGVRVSRAQAIGLKLFGTPMMHLLRLPPKIFAPWGRWWGDDSHFIEGLALLNGMIWALSIMAVIALYTKRSVGEPAVRGQSIRMPSQSTDRTFPPGTTRAEDMPRNR
jgi:hypothetical protein